MFAFSFFTSQKHTFITILQAYHRILFVFSSLLKIKYIFSTLFLPLLHVEQGDSYCISGCRFILLFRGNHMILHPVAPARKITDRHRGKLGPFPHVEPQTRRLVYTMYQFCVTHHLIIFHWLYRESK